MAETPLERDIRIAVVMYGGTSLSIYMNGISQELLQLVRATSPKADPREATSSSARVYRKAAHILAGTPVEHVDDEALDAQPAVRFVIDILSGTSAGGINSVTLAKALARNTGLAPIERLWVEEGEIGKLINDRHSDSQRYPYREPVKALFNSDRMYVELLRAVERLNGPDDHAAEPLVEELELAVTGTDLTGKAVEIQLSDGIAQEYDHRHVFEFRLSGPNHDDFTSEHDPLLAFAARTTSSLPAVFEPADVETAKALAGQRYDEGTPWHRLFPDSREDQLQRHERHAFADGGYLDNKPFGHAIDRLDRTREGVHVTRKLYYLEPTPERIDPDAPLQGIPNALQNTLQVFSLARYETIRADIDRIVRRNRLLDRIQTLGFGVLEDMSLPSASDAEAASADLREATDRLGPIYGGYHRLRVATLTDDVADAIADRAAIPTGSDLRVALRGVVKAWRNAHFRRNADASHRPEADFLRRFDLAYHRRRAKFLVAKINDLFSLNDAVVGELEDFVAKHASDRFPQIRTIIDRYASGERSEVMALWSELQHLFTIARNLGHRTIVALEEGGPDGTAGAALSERSIDLFGPGTVVRETLAAVLERASDADRDAAARRLYEEHDGRLHEVVQEIENQRTARMRDAETALAGIDGLDFQAIGAPEALAVELREFLLMYWHGFLHFDMVQFPLLEATGIGEELSPVEIHRMSPADCRHYGEPDADKLFGTRFASFGAFLDPRWRQHDILWGRLNGAERLISSLLSDANPRVRDKLVCEAHLAILRDAYPAERDAIDGLAVHEADGEGGRRIAVTGTRINTAAFLEEKRRGLELDPHTSARTLSRLVRTSGKLTDTLSTESRLPGAVRNLLGGSAWIGAELLDAGIPKTFRHVVTTYWANLLLLFAVALIVLEVTLGTSDGAGRGVRVGASLAVVAAGFLLLRSLFWRAIAPPVTLQPGAAPRWARRVAWASLAAIVSIAATSLGIGWFAGGDDARDLRGFATPSLALSFARTPGDVACALGQQLGASGCEAPPGVPSGTAAAFVRTVVFLDIGLVLAFAALLSCAAWLASRRASWRVGAVGAVLVGGAVTLGVWDAVRVSATLGLAYDAISEAWLRETGRIAAAAILCLLGSVAILLPPLLRGGDASLLNIRMVRAAAAAAAWSAVLLGVVGLALDVATLLSLGVALLAATHVGLAILIGTGAIPDRARSGA